MIGALTTLGLHVDGRRHADRQWPAFPVPNAQVDCGLAGTVLRFVPPLAALSEATVTFDGDEQARARPIAPLLDALRSLGVGVDGTGLPFRVRARDRSLAARCRSMPRRRRSSFRGCCCARPRSPKGSLCSTPVRRCRPRRTLP
ncbi:EPSP synthase family protein [Mycobacterium xenopi 3993]|nr:EPSP synthase family protein [Mycobacterium xenopi 3993]